MIDHDDEVIKAIEKCRDGLNGISGPRIWTELKKILSYKNSLSILDLIFNQLKLGVYLGFNSNHKTIDRVLDVGRNLDKFNELVDKSKELTNSNQPNELKLTDDDRKLNYLSLICALLDDENELKNLRERLSLSNQELYSAAAIIYYRDMEFDFQRAKKEITLTHKSEKDRKKGWLLEVFKYKGDHESYLALKNQPLPVFPNIGNKIRTKLQNKALVGRYLEKLTLIWIENDYTLTEDELLAKFEEVYEEEGETAKKIKK